MEASAYGEIFLFFFFIHLRASWGTSPYVAHTRLWEDMSVHSDS
jgi:hypothetical protein